MLTKTWKYLLISVWMLICITPAMAARLMGDDSPNIPQQQWVISQIDVHGRTIVINDVTYHLAAAVKVHMAGHKHGSLNDLQAGMHVGYRLADNGKGQSVISEIWEPSGSR